MCKAGDLRSVKIRTIVRCAMINLFGLRQQQLLTLLLENKKGLTVEDLSKALGITDNAVRQHLTALERDGVVLKGETKSTGGRPEHLYGLTAVGEELFPRRYSWFAELLISSLLEEQGTEGLRKRLEGLGRAVGRQVATRLAGIKDKTQRVRTLSGILQELGYQSTSIDPSNEKLPTIEASNCVFHVLAQRYPEVCYFDLALMSEVVGSGVIHDECMVRGGKVCRFKFKSGIR
jgi:predicted ArsR family transcriptional regulator